MTKDIREILVTLVADKYFPVDGTGEKLKLIAEATAQLEALMREARIEELEPLKNSKSWVVTTQYINNRLAALEAGE